MGIVIDRAEEGEDALLAAARDILLQRGRDRIHVVRMLADLPGRLDQLVTKSYLQGYISPRI
ncbi:MAG: hypothetical protein KA170_01765 [Candidatus Promineofilum sp.]|nr:hypothetical protein [Promineifilum sp.]